MIGMEKTLFIISSTAGNTEYNFTKDNIYNVYKRYGLKKNIEIIETKYKTHGKDASMEFINSFDGKKSIIVCGGDGSLNQVANAINHTDTSLGLIPTGTGNDFSKNFSYKNFTIEKTLKRKIKPIDLIDFNGNVSVNVTSVGYDTVVLENAYKFLDKKPSLGKNAYLKAVILSLKDISYNMLDIKLKTIDGKEISRNGEYLLLAICNGGYYGSGFNPAPSAKIDDGILNIVLAKRMPFFKLLSTIIKYKNGNHEASKYLEFFNIKSGKISSFDNFKGNADGEIFQTNELKFKILEKAMNWIYFE